MNVPKIIRCVTNESRVVGCDAHEDLLTVGKEYMALKYNDYNGYYIECDDGCKRWWFPDRFEDVPPYHIEKKEDIPMTKQTGQKWDNGKTDPDLLYDGVPLAIRTVIAVLDYGQAKYGQPHGWKEVPNLVKRYKSASSRHDQKMRLGELKDDESNLAHRAHKIINELFVLQTEIEQGVYGTDYAVFKEPPKAGK